MALPKVDGTKVRGGRYHLNLRIPADAASEYPGKTHLRRSLQTADPGEATRLVTLARAELIEAAGRARQRGSIDDVVAALPPEQREIFEEAGGLEGLLRQYTRADKARAFLQAGGGVTESELSSETPTVAERTMAGAAHKAELVALDRVTETEAKALQALGQDVEASFGLRELLDAYDAAKGTGEQTK
ncbi:DUF6538 domain-containing protein [Mameliella alba]|uniref:DUF6538 domain-containing protein n=1 Tax=Mameliella alba TaxID=561184 RepID=UPI001431F24F|nr:DUF6538 domain-containing protein [Mameliella alba]